MHVLLAALAIATAWWIYYNKEKLMAKLDGVNAALDNIDAATTALAAQVAEILERVKADDVPDTELIALAEKANALATKVSDASGALATVEPVSVPVPPIEEIPVEEPTEPIA